MAVSSAPRGERISIAELMSRRAGEVLGIGLAFAALILAIALWGHDASDPSLNNATAGPSSNPLGGFGASVADLCLQTLGMAAWIPVLVLPCWGVRLFLGRPLDLPWLPILALPPALLAAAAYLATLEVPQSWPYWVGLGGFVGDFALHRVERMVGAQHYPLLALLAAVGLLIVALGVSMREIWYAVRAVPALARRDPRESAIRGGRQPRWATALRRPIGGPGLDDQAGGRPPASGFSFVGSFVGGLASRLKPAEGGMPPMAPVRPEPAAAETAERPVRRRPGAARPAEPERQPSLDLGAVHRAASELAESPAAELVPGQDFQLPPLKYLSMPRTRRSISVDRAALAEMATALEKVLDDFGVRGEIVDVKPGPVVTMFELEPAPGTRAARVIALADDIARSLCAMSVRVAVVPGRNVIGIELPNDQRETVYLRDLLSSAAYEDTSSRLTLALGKDIGGESIVVDLARMPHLLIAGTTGSGKSVAINAMILSLLYRLPPSDCKLIMIDPKVIELSVYEGIPHLLAPVVTEPHKAVVALKWVVREMDERYRLMSHLGVRDLFAYNRRIADAQARGEQLSRRVQTGFEPGTGVPLFEQQPIEMTKMPLVVVIVDEVADLMLTAGKEIEAAIQRLSQKARAAGIHLIVATQRPSVDVLTGVIKANLPSRISFRVSSKIDSRTILGEPGAEQLLGQGDMLHLMPGERTTRIHGPLVTDEEVEQVVTYLKTQGAPEYLEAITDEAVQDATPSIAGDITNEANGNEDAQYAQALQIVAREGKASTSFLQRKLRIGYNSAARLIERMEADGHVSQPDHVGRRQVLMGEKDAAEEPW